MAPACQTGCRSDKVSIGGSFRARRALRRATRGRPRGAARGCGEEHGESSGRISTRGRHPRRGEDGRRLGRLAAPDAPTAIITNSDYTAHGVYKAARELRLQVGPEVSVLGHDDLPTSELLDPPLATIRLDRQEMGRALMRRLLGEVPLDDYIAPVELIARASVQPPVIRASAADGVGGADGATGAGGAARVGRPPAASRA